MKDKPEEVTAAEKELERAAVALDRLQLEAYLRARPGLSYASVGGPGGPYLVAYEGELIGEVCSEQGTALHEWYAEPFAAQSARSGPFSTIRKAAASMIGQAESASGLA